MANSSLNSTAPWQPCRLILDPPATGSWNMAFDEALLHAAAERGVWTLRFYRWSEPTLSLGYFQRWQDRRQHAASRGCPAVRRASGGGAILHDAELTYSLSVAANHRRSVTAEGLFACVHRALAETLHDLTGVAAHLHESSQAAPSPATPGEDRGEGLNRQDEPFLCFQRRSPGDLVVDSAKIAGSAQRRLRGAILQHGSVLLRTSDFAPELRGLASLCGRDLEGGALQSAWSARIATALRLNYTPMGDLAREQSLTAELQASKYGQESWNCRR